MITNYGKRYVGKEQGAPGGKERRQFSLGVSSEEDRYVDPYLLYMTCHLLVGYCFQGRSAWPLYRSEGAVLESFIKEGIFKKNLEE